MLLSLWLLLLLGDVDVAVAADALAAAATTLKSFAQRFLELATAVGAAAVAATVAGPAAPL